MKKFRLFILSTLVFSGMALQAQKVDLGVQLGGGFYDGDLSMPSYFSNTKQINSAVGLVARAEVLPGAVLRGGVLYTKLESDDARSNIDWRMNRNLNFQTKLFEVTAMLELHPIQWIPEFRNSAISPYLFGGMGYISFNPQSQYNGTMVDLQPLGTEGQGMPGYEGYYDLNTLVVPFGLGLRYQWGNFVLDLEYGARRTDTDYLDDTSKNYVSKAELLEEKGQVAADLGNKIDAPTGAQRGNSAVKDWYAVPVLTFAYRFDLDKPGYIYRKKKRKAMDCPSFR